MPDYRRADGNQVATQAAPHRQRLRVEALRRVATERKLLLLECAITRVAPFSQDGRTIWELLPTFEWFTRLMTAHEAIETVERMADGVCTPDEISDADHYLRYIEWAAEADRFGYVGDPEVPGSQLRYGVAYWIDSLAKPGPDLANVLDYYITAYNGQYYAWGCDEPLHTGHRATALALIGDIFGNPFRPAAFDPVWRTDTAVSLARHMYESRDFSPMPILADALQDAGCDNNDTLDHCRNPDQIHVRGCWVVDLVLNLS